ncbi:hypothetical protein [Shewanella xiamenensis]|uniref:hypothetical protein n=1 Tax=Shewanella xiamenensis TaxID=332186 RepID=UPI00118563A8|nr:hypothetical protein [Shewanella xiamenensis]
MKNPGSNCINKKAIIADGFSMKYCEGAALSMRNPGSNCINKKAIIADGFSVKYGGGAGI